jgi:hypothetical protein
MNGKNKVTEIKGSANSFSVSLLKDRLVGQNFRGSKIVDVTETYLVTEKDSFSLLGLQLNFVFE